MMLDNWKVVKASPTRVTVQIQSKNDMGWKSGKPLTYVWDGVGYTRQGSYLHADGIHKLAGSKPADPSKLYPDGTVVQSQEKWVWIIVGKGKPYYNWKDEPSGEYVYKAKKLKGRKLVDLTIEKGGSARVWDGKKFQSLYHVTVRPPR